MASAGATSVTAARRGESKFERILEAALVVFAGKGFHEAKVSEIARVAGVGDGTIYLYFKNKDDLLISLFEVKLEAINVGLRRELTGVTDPLERVDRFIRYHLRLAEENPTLAAFITVELRRSSKFIKEYGKERLTEYQGQLGDAIDAGKAAGLFDPTLSTGIVKHILFGALDHACMVWVTNAQRRAADLREVGDHLIDMAHRTLTRQS